MEKSAGLVLLKDNKILLCHPTKAPWYGTYSIPKGHIEEGESKIEAAIRETKEETGIEISKDEINKEEYKIEYRNKKGKKYKEVYYYIVNVNFNLDDILPREQLELNEINWAGFLNKEEAKKRIFWRFKPMIKLI